jgi:hypothetical protein
VEKSKQEDTPMSVEEVMPGGQFADPKYHVEGSHLIMEHGKAIIQSTLWKCIERVRDLERNMIRMHEHSPFTIEERPKFPSGENQPVTLHKPEYEKEIERGER